MSASSSSGVGVALLNLSQIPCSSSSYQGWRVVGVACGGMIGAMLRFAIGNGVTKWRQRRAERKAAAAKARQQQEAAAQQHLKQQELPDGENGLQMTEMKQQEGVDKTPPLASSSLPPDSSYLTRYLQLWRPIPFPLATFLCNTIGCFLIGLLFGLFILGDEYAQGLLQSQPDLSTSDSRLSIGLCGPLRAFSITGVIGAFTTMSSFALECITMKRARLTLQMILYIVFTNVVSFALAIFGFAITRRFQNFSTHVNT